MKELSLNVLDIAENSLKAGATLTEIYLTENSECLTVTVKDNGCGMTEDTVKSVIDPFYTTRTTRKVGLGIPLFKMAAEQTGGGITIKSKPAAEGDDHGTEISATFYKNHLDFTPIGDIVSTIVTLVQGHPEVDFLFIHTKSGDDGQALGQVSLDTREIRAILEDIPLNSIEILSWIRENLLSQYELLK